MDYSAMTAPELRAWAQDFTYLWIGNCFTYLAAVLDLTTRQIVGWRIGTSHTAELICAALLDAISKNAPPNILHSDQGSEYMSYRHESLCRQYGITMSASKAGSPWQNGFMERVFTTLKSEMPNLSQVKDVGQLHEIIARQIHYYNTKRIHTSLGTSPAKYAAILNSNEKPLTIAQTERVFHGEVRRQ